MPANKYALLRYRIIDRCLTNKARPFPTKDDLREACEDTLYGSHGENISVSTIEKDLWAMRNESELGYYAPIAYHPSEKGYYYTEEDYSIKDIHLNDEDLGAIHFAVNTLHQFKDIPILAHFEEAIDKVVDRFNLTPMAENEEWEDYIQFENSPVVNGSEHLSELVQAIKDKRVTEIVYRKFDSPETKQYNLHPHLLKEYRGRWYLIAKDEKQEVFKTFGIERMEAVIVSNEKFDKEPSFNPDRFFKYSIGITEKDDQPQKIVLKTHPSLSPYFRSQPIHPSQKEIREDEFELHVLITYELINLILGFGRQMEVKSPESFRKEIKNEILLALSRYD